MPTPVDRALQSRNLFFGFAGLVALASVWNMFSGETFPADGRDPDGDPEIWSEAELRQWLRKVSRFLQVYIGIKLNHTSETNTSRTQS